MKLHAKSWRLWIRKNKYIIQFNKPLIAHWYNLFVYQRSIPAKVSISNQQSWRGWSRKFKGPKAFIDYSNDMSTAELKCIIQERNFLIVFDDMSADMISNKKFPSVVTELLLGVENYLSSIHHKIILPGTKGSKTINTTHFIMKIQNKWELQQIATNHLSHFDFLKG